ncbi:PNC family class C beta-lactamase [Pandoraea norimbergensis]|uniref:Beta-lactamase n=2 Tax=Pandoraea norimbergensis TaxID=93219 RepID=A0ABN4JH28_9BURK|nr:class C beta-lactamase [Pandoraea norimbergensis]
MQKRHFTFLTPIAAIATLAAIGWMAMSAGSYAAQPGADPQRAAIKKLVDQTAASLMKDNAVPGMAVGVIVDGKSYVFNYGVADKTANKPVTADTLFEIGSVSKTFTATLTAYAQTTGALSLTDKTSRFLPSLAGTPFGELTLLNLGTHTAGSLPLQLPDGIRDDDQLLAYLKTWKPAKPPGTVRTYSNVSIGTLGWITSRSMGSDFTTLMTQHVFTPLGLSHTYLHVPADQMTNYAWGYSKTDKPVRIRPDILESEAYGVRTTAGDLLRFVSVQLGKPVGDAKLQQAIHDTRIGYYFDSPMTQDLIWEQYPYPVTLDSLLAGNGPKMAYETTSARELSPSIAPTPAVWVNKTGSTNGFGAYVAFVPAKQMGIVILANKAFPIAERVRAAHQILSTLDGNAR